MDAVTALTTPAPEAEDTKADLRHRIFGIVEDALFELSDNCTPALVILLRELATVPGLDLKHFGDSWSDSWKQSHWREALKTRD